MSRSKALELEVENGECHDKTSLHSEHLPNSVPDYMRPEAARMAYSVEDIHVDIEGPTYLAGNNIKIIYKSLTPCN